MKRRLPVTAFIFCGLLLIRPLPAAGQTLRSLGDLYPNLGAGQRGEIFSEEGLIVSGRNFSGLAILPDTPESAGIASRIALAKDSAFITESLRVIPGQKAALLSIYNALGKTAGLKGRLYHSASRNKYVPLFENAVRLESAKGSKTLADPPPASVVPPQETIYARLRDINFGSCYYEIKLVSNDKSITYELTNFKTISLAFFPVVEAYKFNAALYVEPLEEGLLIYSAASAEVSDFIAQKISMTSALQKRNDVIIGWMLDGLP